MNTKKSEIIQTLKDTYSRDLRKQVVKTILANENKQNTADNKIIDEIFSYVLNALNWKLPEKSEEWDYTPLDIMEETFPKIETTKWFEVQVVTARKMIEKMEMEG